MSSPAVTWDDEAVKAAPAVSWDDEPAPKLEQSQAEADRPQPWEKPQMDAIARRNANLGFERATSLETGLPGRETPAQPAPPSVGKAPAVKWDTPEIQLAERTEQLHGAPLRRVTPPQPEIPGVKLTELPEQPSSFLPQGAIPAPISGPAVSGVTPEERARPTAAPTVGGLVATPETGLVGRAAWQATGGRIGQGMEELYQSGALSNPMGYMTPPPTRPIPVSAEKQMQGITDVMGGAGTAMLPLAVAGAIAAPIPTAAALGGAWAGSTGAEYLARKANLSPTAQRLLGELGGWAGAFAGGFAGGRFSDLLLPKEKGLVTAAEAARREAVDQHLQNFRDIVEAAGVKLPEDPTFTEARAAYARAQRFYHPDTTNATRSGPDFVRASQQVSVLSELWDKLSKSGAFPKEPKPITAENLADQIRTWLDESTVAIHDAAAEKAPGRAAEAGAKETPAEAAPAAPAPQGAPPEVVQASTEPSELRASAAEQKPALENMAEGVTKDVPGAQVEGARVKHADSQENKEARGKPAETSIDHLGARVSGETPEAIEEVKKNIETTLPVVSHETIDANGLNVDQYGIQTGGPGDANQVSELQVASKAQADAMKETDPLYAEQKEALAAGDQAKADQLGQQITAVHEAAQKREVVQKPIVSQTTTPVDQKLLVRLGEYIQRHPEELRPLGPEYAPDPNRYKIKTPYKGRQTDELELHDYGKALAILGDLGHGWGSTGNKAEIEKAIRALLKAEQKPEPPAPTPTPAGPIVKGSKVIVRTSDKEGTTATAGEVVYVPKQPFEKYRIKPLGAGKVIELSPREFKEQVSLQPEYAKPEAPKVRWDVADIVPTPGGVVAIPHAKPESKKIADARQELAFAKKQLEEAQRTNYNVPAHEKIVADAQKTLDGLLEPETSAKAEAGIGSPIAPMVEHIKDLLAQGQDVRIFSAEVANDPTGEKTREIQQFSQDNLGKVLPITAEKSPDMAYMLDNKGNVETNTGKILVPNLPTPKPGQWIGVDYDGTLVKEAPEEGIQPTGGKRAPELEQPAIPKVADRGQAELEAHQAAVEQLAKEPANIAALRKEQSTLRDDIYRYERLIGQKFQPKETRDIAAKALKMAQARLDTILRELADASERRNAAIQEAPTPQRGIREGGHEPAPGKGHPVVVRPEGGGRHPTAEEQGFTIGGFINKPGKQGAVGAPEANEREAQRFLDDYTREDYDRMIPAAHMELRQGGRIPSFEEVRDTYAAELRKGNPRQITVQTVATDIAAGIGLGAPPTGGGPRLLNLGESQQIMGIRSMLVNVTEGADGMRYEIYQELGPKAGAEHRGAIVVRDLDSGNVADVTQYPTMDEAVKKYNATVRKPSVAGEPATKPEQPAAANALYSKILFDDSERIEEISQAARNALNNTPGTAQIEFDRLERELTIASEHLEKLTDAGYSQRRMLEKSVADANALLLDFKTKPQSQVGVPASGTDITGRETKDFRIGKLTGGRYVVIDKASGRTVVTRDTERQAREAMFEQQREHDGELPPEPAAHVREEQEPTEQERKLSARKFITSKDLAQASHDDLQERVRVINALTKEFTEYPNGPRNRAVEIMAKELEDIQAEMAKRPALKQQAKEPTPAQAVTEKIAAVEKTGINKLVDAIYDKIKRGESLGNVTELNKMAEQHLGASRVSGEWTPKDVFDAMEAGVNKYLLDRGKELIEMPADNALLTLKNIERLITSQGVRTEEQIKNQQFSTPPREAFVVAKVANIKPSDVVLEPSAGNGGLAVWPKAIGAEVHVNEIAPRRQAMLEAVGLGKPTAHDGELINALLDPSIKPTVIIMNPPFSASTQKSYEAKNLARYGFNHVEQALQRLAPGGRLVTILGGGREGFQASEGANLRSGEAGKWFDKIAQRYNVRANIRVSGKEYQKYGTAYSTRIIVIDKDGPTPKSLAGTTYPGPANWRNSVVEKDVDNLEEAYNALRPVEESRPELVSTRPAGETAVGRPTPSEGVATGAGAGGGGLRGGAGEITRPHGEIPTPGGRAGAPVSAPTPRPGGGGQQPGGGQPTAAVEPRKPGEVEHAAPSAGEGVVHGEREQPLAERGLDLEEAEAKAQRDDEEEASAYQTYKPTLKGAKHPGSIVETKAMATVPMPPLTYKPVLPESVVGKAPDYKDAKLSAVQLEAVSIAGMQNNIVLPNGARASALIGDGTGVGKGRISAAILWDNWRQGRRRLLWVSKNKDLMQDAIRDLNGIGATELAKTIRDFGGIKGDATIEHQGILFSTYSLFRSKTKTQGGKTRAQQLDEWLRGDDDGEGGYMLMDESHNLKNAVVAQQGGPPSQQGLAVKNFLEKMPKLRTVSLSATAATDVMNLGYLDRLGLWGPGTPFPGGFAQFAGEIAQGGMSAMEMIARELKSHGKYVSRTLTYRGVEYSEPIHELNENQKTVYRSAVTAWRNITASIEDTIRNTTGGGARQRALAMSQFYAQQQRFFNLLITALKVPTAVKLAEAALADGKSVAITFINTNEAAQNRERDRVAALDEDQQEIPDYDFGPGRMLTDLVREHYPTQQYMDDVGPDGKPVKVPVVDDKGNPVLNPEAVAARDALIADLEANLHMPANPLDDLIEQLGGPSKVAEITGRKERIDPLTGKFVKRGGEGVTQDKVGIAEAQAFQSGKKRILLCSSKADTGLSFHADKAAKNQQRRYVITLQVGWSADKAMQMNGRFNRSNQVSAPEYALLRSDLGGEARFISSIARRMQSLEALSKGQTKTNAGTEAMSKLAFETDQGESAAAAFYNQLLRNIDIPNAFELDENDKPTDKPLQGYGVLRSMGVLKGSPETVPLADRQNVTKLLNRILAFDPDQQNGVFNYFFDTFDAIVKQAEANGTLDTGVKRLAGDEFAIKDVPALSADPKTGAQTFHYPIDSQVKQKLLNAREMAAFYEKSKARSDKPIIWKNDKGEMALTVEAKPIVNADGNVIEAYHIVRPEHGIPEKIPQHTMERGSWKRVDQEVQNKMAAAETRERRADKETEDYKKYIREAEAPDAQPYQKNNLEYYKRELAKAEADYKTAHEAAMAARKEVRQTDVAKLARDDWQKQHDAAPTHLTREVHLIGGAAIMRFWNVIREATGHHMDVYTAVDGKTGKRVVGIQIPANQINRLIARISGGKSTVTSEQIIPDVLQNGTEYQLEGGIKITRGRVASQNVVKFSTAKPDVQEFLKKQGVIYERGIQPIYYLPRPERGDRIGELNAQQILDRVLAQYPVVVEGQAQGGEGGGTVLPMSIFGLDIAAKKLYRAVVAVDAAYDQGIDAFLQKIHMGRAFPQVEREDDQVAADLRELAAAPQYYRAKAEAIIQKIVGDMEPEQEKGFMLLADQASRDWLRDNRPAEYRRYMADNRIQQALADYKPEEDKMRDLQRALGGPVIEEDYMRRVYSEHVAGIGKKTAKGEKVSPTSYDRVITPQMANKQGRFASPEYYYEHGLHEFGPSFATRYMANNLKMAEHRAAIHFLNKATRIDPKDGLPESIMYNGERYFRPDVARLIREAVPESAEGQQIAADLGVTQLPKPSKVREFSVYDPTPPDKSDYQAKKLAQMVAEAADNASGTKLREEDMDALIARAAAINYSSHPLYAGPKAIVEAFQTGANHVIPEWSKDAQAILGPITGMVRRNIIGMGMGVPHIKNILRRVLQTSPGAQLDPRSWARAAKVLFSDELRRRGIAGVEDPTFDMLLRHAAISDKGIESYLDYLDGNLDGTRLERTWNLLRAAIPDEKQFIKDMVSEIRQHWREGGAISKLTAVTKTLATVVEAPLRPFMRIGHHIIFSRGGIDQRARLWLADLIKSQEPDITEDELAQELNAQLGRYNKASWTDVQRDLQFLTFFPGWSYSSAEWVLRHPLKTTIAAAMLVLLANQIIQHYRKNKKKDSTDLSRVHFGNYTISDNLFRERLGMAEMGMPSRLVSSMLEGKHAEPALRGALSGVGADARAFVGELNPLVTTPVEIGFGKELATGREIVPQADRKKPWKAEKDWLYYAGRKLFPGYSQAAAPQKGQSRGEFLMHNLGVNVYKNSKKRR